MAAALYFCNTCADKRVRDVKTELELLFRTKQIDPLKCGICSEVRLKKESVEVKKENQQESLETDKTQESIAKTQSAQEFDIVAVDLAISREFNDKTELFKDADYTASDESDVDDGDTGSNYSDEIESSKDKSKAAKNVGENKGKKKRQRAVPPVKTQAKLDVSEVNPELKDMMLEGSITPKEFACKICKKEFKWNARMMVTFSVHLGEHMEQTDTLKPFKCPLCTSYFNYAHSLKSHTRAHSNPLLFECPHPDCDRKFKHKSSIRQHKVIAHGGVPRAKTHACQLCNAVFEFPNKLKNHMLRHQDLKAFKCSVCGKSFVDKANLSRHQERHTDAKKSVCEVCGKTFVSKDELRTHRITHSDVRIYQCEYCPYRAKRLGTLKAHIRNIHTESDPNKCKCDVCGLTFLSPTACRKHEKKHQSGLDLAEALLKPHKCPDCGYRASKPCYIRIHRRSHTGEKNFACDYCQRAFVQRGQCTRHMKICQKR